MKWYTIKHECLDTETILRSRSNGFPLSIEFVNISGANLIERLGQCPLVKSTRGEPGFESKIVDDK